MVFAATWRGALSVVALSLIALTALHACGEPDLKCAGPAGSIAAEGTFVIDFIGETASVSSDTMQVRVTPIDANAIDVWACQERGEQMWIVELSVTRPAAGTLPATFGTARTTPHVSAHLSRYDQYQLLEDQLGQPTAGRLVILDDSQGVLTFDAQLSEPCAALRCQADNRTLTLDVDLSWEAP